MKTLAKKLAQIQRELNAPKSQFNSFGKYNYRNCEDIMTALKPFLDSVYVTVSDSMEMVGNRIYVKATATISDGENKIENTAFAREAETKKGMDDSQLTGSTSSYARKYALAGLFLVDDNKDADHSPAQALTDTDKQWVAAAKQNPESLNQITDAAYKSFIKQQAGI